MSMHIDCLQRFGVWADWDHPYLTLDPEYEAAQVPITAFSLVSLLEFLEVTYTLHPSCYMGQNNLEGWKVHILMISICYCILINLLSFLVISFHLISYPALLCVFKRHCISYLACEASLIFFMPIL